MRATGERRRQQQCEHGGGGGPGRPWGAAPAAVGRLGAGLLWAGGGVAAAASVLGGRAPGGGGAWGAAAPSLRPLRSVLVAALPPRAPFAPLLSQARGGVSQAGAAVATVARQVLRAPLGGPGAAVRAIAVAGALHLATLQRSQRSAVLAALRRW